ncbi:MULTISPECIES: hypothetical protein [unclassified Pseudoalteromonas]|uniref:hypothetical protein n=1 Tax=unclassified Pseudoalteromonas TaxID=194690 RepID=UPI0003F63F78|nr:MULTISPECIES: hypothetical protein [unclassified Pseudoalteromonas]MBH0033992.1 hypothetical protein [Pseudoalteromonas sp. NZS71_1]
MSNGKMVLSTSLLIAYENREKHQKKYKKLMQKISLPYLTNHKQMIEAKDKGLDIVDYERLLSQLANRSDASHEIEQLATLSSYKVILTDEENPQLPFVNYKEGLIDKTVSVHLKPEDDRTFLLNYLRLICSNATKVVVCDNYLASNWVNTKALFLSILPRQALTIEYVDTPDDIQAIKNSLKITPQFVSNIYNNWTVQVNTEYSGFHDRYLKVYSPESNIEIMLSSGFDHLWKNNPKEITCVFREI